ncbi:MAG: MmcB family DNA repair protein [Magnetospirillum sp.]|nr:MmcB family DNA repair protein [Magnetospirillum sp.]
MTERLARGAARHLANMGAGVVAEFRLPSGRRLDLLALLPDGRLWAVEVKSGIEDFLADRKWSDYLDWCDALFFCVDPAFPLALVPEAAGVLVADSFDAQVLRQAPAHSLHPSRRKAMTLRFGLVAARRLQGAEDPFA